ncbi:MAG: aspartyl/glutamyl-tRNA amidotransferase subunit A [Omnitrophica bacterium RIFCSPLOWO2_12_FULL_44_17]|uniref:Glutamyl-tRNA(Gln) amidotransferase subunit A n=1 Tax=Candidatus Danuiimicrobium aquiferis TaxID=1801832 RepID=A0A1G1KSZ9_9BACT|nr:MAG: aspartyl/glutamyl-tRNA amidotransferase subunit A [Omnitrophica bacterium RIFCSPHIGHO2_02_FULL_45_28]OGW91445.1 MAG: aspartyl/glutamyl-tRNA amidotransferase subunit A [Omnitrophica bacterium RIFCSPHIGHO2_12_FULL_44_12]OGW95922.1 MAG: aspartyl/glutamyl-tRNA amidotransferase subunit A [Omnitrophica bacterium RIFCSPLOWO2_12_FULL_44_17]OGX01921.1 MAG: aspartyl/glutamyl-tRNA amidotransferase subunit A [Omnitrophica bacterium RIFCSPLOWO2_02_FULL_44_11]
MEPYRLTLKQAREFVGKDLSKRDQLLDALVRRVNDVDPRVNAYVHFDPKHISSQKQAELKGPLAGIPISIKDNMVIKGWETTCASNILKGFIPPYDATVIRKLRDAGAVIFGKCNMDEFAFGSSCETSAFGPTRNPWNLDCVSGGSSGGSAACVASDTAIAALGSDTGGSIRQPASLCGVVGLKPTYGRVSRYGLIAFGSSLDQIGPLTKTVEDSAILLNVIAGHDERDSTSAEIPVPDYTAFLGKNVKGLKIGIPKEYFVKGLDSEVEKAVRAAIKVFQDLGASIAEVSLPHMKYSVAVYYIVAVAEASSNLGRYDGVQYGLRCEKNNLVEMYFETRDQGFGAEAKRRILLGTFVLSAGYYDAYYVKGLKARTLIKQDFDRVFEKVDLIIGPVSPTPAFKIGEKLDDPLSMYLSDIYTIAANLAGVPAMSVPCGFSLTGLPIGLQLTAKPFEEGTIFRVASAYEATMKWNERKPEL